VAPFVDLGLVPEAASSWLLPQRIGHARAAQMLMLGEPVDATRALNWGLFNEIVPAEEVLSRALQAAQTLSQKPPEALRLSKMLLKEADTSTVEARIAREAAIFSERLTSPETAEAIMAFFERRKSDSKL
jgi:enoyl-CoA hydratase/carnithine racemase